MLHMTVIFLPSYVHF